MAGERLSDADVDGLLWHGCSSGTQTPQFVRDMIVKAATELRERRAADLTAEDIRNLVLLRRRIDDRINCCERHDAQYAAGVAVLDRLAKEQG